MQPPPTSGQFNQTQQNNWRETDWCYKPKDGDAADNRHPIHKEPKQKPAKFNAREMLLNLATLVMFLLLVIPSWNAVGLWQDGVFTYVAGRHTIMWLMICCVSLFAISWFTLRIFLQRLRPELRTEQTMLMVSGIFLSTLGIMLILFGGPIARQAMQAHRLFMDDCRFGAGTAQLYVAFEELKSLRATPDCMALDSIEECAGFHSYPKQDEAEVLKEMESSYSCSGLCQGINAQGDHIYPPTLFSKANNKLSCDGMAARRMMNFAAEVSSQMVAEGCMLVATAICISFGQLIAFCSRTKPGDKRALNTDPNALTYGTVSTTA